jgi:SRSO17 transposase
MYGQWGGMWTGPVSPIYGRNQGGFDASRYFGALTPTDDLFYQSSAGMPFAYQQFANTEARPDSHYNRWLQNQEGWVTSNFVNASRANPDLKWTDYTVSQAPNLAQRYLALPTWQQGMNPAAWYAGRRL